MNWGKQLILIDGDFRRRAAITHCLAGEGIHVEPFEDVAELGRRWPRSGVMFVHDENDAVRTLISQMGQTGRWLPVVAFSEDPTVERVVGAMHLGAVDYLGWPCDPQKLAQTVTSIGEKADMMSQAKVREAMARARIEKLTKREREVLAGVAGGLSNRKIGERLAISPRTVEIHRANMLHKMGANHTSEAIRIATEAALLV